MPEETAMQFHFSSLKESNLSWMWSKVVVAGVLFHCTDAHMNPPIVYELYISGFRDGYLFD